MVCYALYTHLKKKERPKWCSQRSTAPATDGWTSWLSCLRTFGKNHGEIMGKSWEIRGKLMEHVNFHGGNSWEIDGTSMEKWWFSCWFYDGTWLSMMGHEGTSVLIPHDGTWWKMTDFSRLSNESDGKCRPQMGPLDHILAVDWAWHHHDPVRTIFAPGNRFIGHAL